MACIALVAPAQAADELSFGPVPSWVEVQAVPSGSAPEGPINVLLSDTQAKLEPDATATYSHHAVRINDAQGLAAGTVIAAWDPAFETVTIHPVAIHRPGPAIAGAQRGLGSGKTLVGGALQR